MLIRSYLHVVNDLDILNKIKPYYSYAQPSKQASYTKTKLIKKNKNINKTGGLCMLDEPS